MTRWGTRHLFAAAVVSCSNVVSAYKCHFRNALMSLWEYKTVKAILYCIRCPIECPTAYTKVAPVGLFFRRNCRHMYSTPGN
jgi:hypothetical protein